MVVWSRRGASSLDPEAVALIDELAAQGVCVKPVARDVSNREQVLRGVQNAVLTAVSSAVSFTLPSRNKTFRFLPQRSHWAFNDVGVLTSDTVTVNLFVRAEGQTVTGNRGYTGRLAKISAAC
ncbi:hypothetical protein BDV09DRAFT_200307 [Aspergillus tetrazonus]